ncbi:MAG: transcriptional repressor [Candidatus Marsarchaeota archaeon]|nr:transcriptional repressor [Candidatus Marsarchaeota archaeon]
MIKERKTKQKKAILKYLDNNTSHPTAEEVHEAVKKEISGISLGTIYRELNKMSEKKQIRKIEGKKRRFDYNTSSHAHFKCLKCGEILDIDYKIDYKKQNGFEIKSHELMFNGICKKCKGDE